MCCYRKPNCKIMYWFHCFSPFVCRSPKHCDESLPVPRQMSVQAWHFQSKRFQVDDRHHACMLSPSIATWAGQLGNSHFYVYTSADQDQTIVNLKSAQAPVVTVGEQTDISFTVCNENLATQLWTVHQERTVFERTSSQSSGWRIVFKV